MGNFKQSSPWGLWPLPIQGHTGVLVLTTTSYGLSPVRLWCSWSQVRKPPIFPRVFSGTPGNEGQVGRCRQGTCHQGLFHIHFLEAQVLVRREEHERDKERKAWRGGGKTPGNPKTLTCILVPIVRRRWGHQPCTHRTALFW